MEKITSSPFETQKLAKVILKTLGSINTICLYGEMGAGKTTLVQGIAKELGIKAKIISPTFVLVRRYKINSQFPASPAGRSILKSQLKYLWHIDLYRLEDLHQIRDLGIAEIWQDKNNLVIIEWAERLNTLLPENKIDIRLESISENERKILL